MDAAAKRAEDLSEESFEARILDWAGNASA